MSGTWTFGDLEFKVMWEILEEDFLPWPLVFTSRTALWEDYLQEKAEVKDRLRRTLDPALREVLEAMQFPDIRLVVYGWDDRDGLNPDFCLRVLGVRRADRGLVVKQRCGETIWHSAGFEVTECGALELGERIVSALPPAAAGRMADVVLLTEADGDLDYTFGDSAVRDSFADSVVHRSEAFLGKSAASIGTIEIIQGHSVFGPRGITKHVIGWRDLQDDGRYAIEDQYPKVAVPADHKRMTTMVNTRIAAVIRAIKDEPA
ncbi:ESX secretion-associated protein EspG [Nocardia australiensis]|uniref:ESX secretion-associated protein EspG n=1 Tax=Nocardia australiensis TaxID=2887191 RepID=UPI001D1384E5|nr:ESX secretion-associated protein EspG [Nocardia australiensis]